jgi:hypothetical protein
VGTVLRETAAKIKNLEQNYNAPGALAKRNVTVVAKRDTQTKVLPNAGRNRLYLRRRFRTVIRMPGIVVVNDKMQQGYRYELVAPMGCDFDPAFQPQLTPKQMLELGVFGGKYLTDCRSEFPADWFAAAKLSPQGRNVALNYFGVDASQSLSEWRRKGWIHSADPRGWFQWYCRYYMGRRMDDDPRQIARWRQIARHAAQLRKACEPGDVFCRPRQRQALLHWAYDSRTI